MAKHRIEAPAKSAPHPQQTSRARRSEVMLAGACLTSLAVLIPMALTTIDEPPYFPLLLTSVFVVMCFATSALAMRLFRALRQAEAVVQTKRRDSLHATRAAPLKHPDFDDQGLD